MHALLRVRPVQKDGRQRVHRGAEYLQASGARIAREEWTTNVEGLLGSVADADKSAGIYIYSINATAKFAVSRRTSTVDKTTIQRSQVRHKPDGNTLEKGGAASIKRESIPCTSMRVKNKTLQLLCTHLRT